MFFLCSLICVHSVSSVLTSTLFVKYFIKSTPLCALNFCAVQKVNNSRFNDTTEQSREKRNALCALEFLLFLINLM